MEKWRAAFHEAGHVVVCHYLNKEYEAVTIKPEGQFAGKVLHGEVNFPDLNDDLATIKSVSKRELLVAYGGIMTEVILCGDMIDNTAKSKEIMEGSLSDLDCCNKLSFTLISESKKDLISKLDRWDLFLEGFCSSKEPTDFDEAIDLCGMREDWEKVEALQIEYRLRVSMTLYEHWTEVEAIADALLRSETLTSAECRAIIVSTSKGPLRRPERGNV